MRSAHRSHEHLSTTVDLVLYVSLTIFRTGDVTWMSVGLIELVFTLITFITFQIMRWANPNQTPVWNVEATRLSTCDNSTLVLQHWVTTDNIPFKKDLQAFVGKTQWKRSLQYTNQVLKMMAITDPGRLTALLGNGTPLDFCSEYHLLKGQWGLRDQARRFIRSSSTPFSLSWSRLW